MNRRTLPNSRDFLVVLRSDGTAGRVNEMREGHHEITVPRL